MCVDRQEPMCVDRQEPMCVDRQELGVCVCAAGNVRVDFMGFICNYCRWQKRRTGDHPGLTTVCLAVCL